MPCCGVVASFAERGRRGVRKRGRRERCTCSVFSAHAENKRSVVQAGESQERLKRRITQSTKPAAILQKKSRQLGCVARGVARGVARLVRGSLRGGGRPTNDSKRSCAATADREAPCKRTHGQNLSSETPSRLVCCLSLQFSCLSSRLDFTHSRRGARWAGALGNAWVVREDGCALSQIVWVRAPAGYHWVPTGWRRRAASAAGATRATNARTRGNACPLPMRERIRSRWACADGQLRIGRRRLGLGAGLRAEGRRSEPPKNERRLFGEISIESCSECFCRARLTNQQATNPCVHRG